MTSELINYRERFERNPSDRKAFLALEGDLFLRGSWEHLIPLYEQHLAAARGLDRAERARTLCRFGQALEEGQTASERAAECYRKALELDADFELARRRLRRLHAGRGEWDKALLLMQEEAQRSSDSERRLALQVEIGAISLSGKSDPRFALQAFDAVLQDHPDHTGALLGRARSLESLERWEEAEHAWEKTLPYVGPEIQKEIYRSLAALLERKDGDGKRLLDLYWRAHAACPDDSAWIEAIYSLLAERGGWEDAVALGEERLARALSGQREAEIAFEIGLVCSEQLHHDAAAKRWFQLAYERYGDTSPPTDSAERDTGDRKAGAAAPPRGGRVGVRGEFREAGAPPGEDVADGGPTPTDTRRTDAVARESIGEGGEESGSSGTAARVQEEDSAASRKESRRSRIDKAVHELFGAQVKVPDVPDAPGEAAPSRDRDSVPGRREPRKRQVDGASRRKAPSAPDDQTTAAELGREERAASRSGRAGPIRDEVPPSAVTDSEGHRIDEAVRGSLVDRSDAQDVLGASEPPPVEDPGPAVSVGTRPGGTGEAVVAGPGQLLETLEEPGETGPIPDDDPFSIHIAEPAPSIAEPASERRGGEDGEPGEEARGVVQRGSPERAQTPDAEAPAATARAEPETPDAAGQPAEAEDHEARTRQLLSGLERRLQESATQPEEQTKLLLQIGALRCAPGGDLEAGAEAYRRCLALDPEQRRARDELEGVLWQLGRHDELIELLQDAVAALPAAERPPYFCRLGQLQLEHGAGAEAALDAFEGALEIDGSSATALAGLRKALQICGDDGRRLRAAELEFPYADAKRLTELVPEIIRLCRNGSQPERALAPARHWLRTSPHSEPAFQGVAELLTDLGRNGELATLLETNDERLRGSARAANRRRLGVLYAAEGRLDHAVQAWIGALHVDPGDTASADALISALCAAGRFAELLAAFDRDLDVQLRRRPGIARQRAAALRATGQRREALAAYRELWRDDPADRELLRNYELTAREEDDAPALVEALAERARFEPEAATRHALQFERAVLVEERLHRFEEARSSYRSLAATAGDETVGRRAQQRLMTLLEQLGDYAGLCEELERGLSTAAPEEATALHERVAEIASELLGDPQRARDHWEAVVAVEPERWMTWRRLSQFYEAADQPRQLLRTLEGQLAAPAPEEYRLGLHARAAGLYAGPAGDPGRAEAHYREVLERDSTQPEARVFLLEHLAAAQRHEEWEDFSRQQLKALRGAEYAAERSQLAIALAARLARRDADLEEAIGLLERAREDGNETPEVVAQRLAPLYRRAERVEDHVRICEEAARAATQPAAASSWWAQLADALHASSDAPGAVRAWERALDGASGSSAQQIRRNLEMAYRESGAAEQLAPLLEERLVHCQQEDATALALRAELATLYRDTLDVPERALEHAEQLARAKPRQAQWRETALDLAEGLNQVERALTLLRYGAEKGAPTERGALWERCGQLLSGVLERPDEALDSYRRALAADPGLASARRALRRGLEERGRYAEALTLLWEELDRAVPEQQLELAVLGVEWATEHLDVTSLYPWLQRLEVLAVGRPQLLLRCAALYARGRYRKEQERALAAASRHMDPDAESIVLRDLHCERSALLLATGDADRALAALESAWKVDPDHAETARELSARYAREGRHGDLLAVLTRRLATAQGDEHTALQWQIANLCTEQLGAWERAAALWTELLAWDAPDLGVEAGKLPSLATVFAATGRYECWAAIARVELQHAAEDSSLPRLWELRAELAALCAEQLARPREALSHLRILVDGGRATPEQRRQLLELLLATGQAAEWARRMEAQLRDHPDDAAGHLAAAQLAEERLGSPAQAVASYRAAALLSPDSEAAWAGLRRCGERCGAWADVAAALERQLELRCVDETGGLRALGSVYENELGDLTQARRRYERLLELEPTSLEAMRCLRRVVTACADWASLHPLLTREIAALAGEPSATRPLWLELASLRRDRLEDFQGASEAFERADRLEPLEAEHLAAWSEIQERLGERKRWAQLFERWCDHPGSDSQATDHVALAQRWTQLGEPHRACERAERGVALDPRNADAWCTAAELHGQLSRPEPAAAAWRQAAELATGVEAAQRWQRAAEHLEVIEDRASAWDCYWRGAKEDPQSIPALAGVARLGGALGHSEATIESACRLLGLEVAGVLPEASYAEALCGGATAAVEKGNWARALELANELLRGDPDHLEGLWIRGRAHFSMGRGRDCIADLERRRVHPGSLRRRERAELLELLGLSLYQNGERELAIERLSAALELDPEREASHRGLCEALERMGRSQDAAHAHANWAELAPPGRARAERFAKAAELLESFDPEAQTLETWLRAAIAADPKFAPPRISLVRRLSKALHFDDALREIETGIELGHENRDLANFEMLRGKLLERQRDLRGALEAYRRTAELDQTSVEAARSAARLLRGDGDWRGAADLLLSFCSSCPPSTSSGEAFLDLGRLLAGPLEDIPRAIDAYRRARDLAPHREDVRESLADLLAQFDGTREEAIAEHSALLRADPTRMRSIRALVGLAKHGEQDLAARNGLAILSALGELSVFERGRAASHLRLPLAHRPPAVSPLGEMLRKALHAASPIWGDVLPQPQELPHARESKNAAIDAYREAYEAAEIDLWAPGWCSLNREAAEAALQELVGGLNDTAVRAALEAAGSRIRRRVRRELTGVEIGQLQGFHVPSWQRELEIHTHCTAIDATGGDLRSALLFALAVPTQGASLAEAPDAGLTPQLEEGGLARALLKRVLAEWVESLTVRPS